MNKIIVSCLLLGMGSASAAEMTWHHDYAQKTVSIADGKRLADAYQHFQFNAELQWDGAFLTTPRLAEKAHRERISLLGELDALASSNSELAKQISTLKKYLNSLNVAERIMTKLDPDWVILHEQDNRPLKGAYSLYTKNYPVAVTVVSPTEQISLSVIEGGHCADYLAKLSSDSIQDNSQAYLIQADGKILQVGVANWNERADQVVMPGAIIFTGFAPSVLSEQFISINQHIAAVLANRIPL